MPTEYVTKTGDGSYEITFDTTDYRKYLHVEEACRRCIDHRESGTIPVEWIEKWRDEKGRHMSERLVAGKIIVDWKWSLSEEDRKKYGID